MKAYNLRSGHLVTHHTALAVIQQAGECQYVCGKDDRGYYISGTFRPETIDRIQWFLNY